MARIFVAHQQEGAQSPLAGLADAVKEQRMMQEEQRRYEQEVVFERKKLAHQQERERAQDRMAKRELAMRETLTRAQAGYYQARGEAERAEAAASISGVIPQDPELESSRQTALNGFVAQTGRLSARVSGYGEGDRPSKQELMRRQARYGAIRERMMVAQSSGELSKLQGQLDDLVTEDSDYLDEWEQDIKEEKFGAERERLLSELSPEFLTSTGTPQNELDRILEDVPTNDEESQEQLIKLRNLISNSKRYAALEKQFSDWASGVGEPGEVDAWSLWEDTETEDNPFMLDGYQELYETYQNTDAPMAKRVDAGKQIMAWTAARANPKTQRVIEGAQRMDARYKAQMAELESELDIAERLQQKGWPDYASVNSAIDMLTEPSIEVVSPEAKVVATHLDEAWSAGTWADEPRPVMALLRDTKRLAIESGMSADEADSAIDEIQDALKSMTTGDLQPAFMQWIGRAGKLPERQAESFPDGTFADDPERIKAERKFRGRR